MDLNDYDIDCLNAAKNLIEKHLEWHHTIPEIAKQVGMNKSKLKKSFKQLFGMGAYEFLQHARMEKARLLLSETRKSLKQIAHSVGYKYPGNFSTAFEKKYEQKPADFRKKIKSNANYLEIEAAHSKNNAEETFNNR